MTLFRRFHCCQQHWMKVSKCLSGMCAGACRWGSFIGVMLVASSTGIASRRRSQRHSEAWCVQPFPLRDCKPHRPHLSPYVSASSVPGSGSAPVLGARQRIALLEDPGYAKLVCQLVLPHGLIIINIKIKSIIIIIHLTSFSSIKYSNIYSKIYIFIT